MNFDHALIKLMQTVQARYGMTAGIKKIVVNDQIYKQLEWECLKKAMFMQQDYDGKPTIIRFYAGSGYIDIVKDEDE